MSQKRLFSIRQLLAWQETETLHRRLVTIEHKQRAARLADDTATSRQFAREKRQIQAELARRAGKRSKAAVSDGGGGTGPP